MPNRPIPHARSPLSRLASLVISASIASACVGSAWAAWPENGLLVDGGPGPQFAPIVCSDASGGAFVAWYRLIDETSADLVLQRFTAGTIHPGWPTSGVVVSRAVPAAHAIAVDGASGVFVLSIDALGDPPGRYRLRHFDATAQIAPGSPPEGRRLSTTDTYEGYGVLLPDLAGGVFAAWADMQEGDLNVRAQRFAADCSPYWAGGGVRPRPAFSGQQSPVIARDGGGGVWLGWIDDGLGMQSMKSNAFERIRMVHHVRPDGTLDPALPSGGKTIANFEVYADLRMASDGAGGVYTLWNGANANYTQYGSFAQRLAANGAVSPGWPALGFVYSTQIGRKAIEDGSGGMMIGTVGYNAEVARYEARLQSLLADATIADGWGAGGVWLGYVDYVYGNPTPIPDGQGGTIVIWAEDTAPPGETNLVARRVLQDGPLAGPRREICMAPGMQASHEVVEDEAGGVFVAWNDSRVDDGDVYLLRVPAADLVAGVSTTLQDIQLGGPRPNPSSVGVEAELTLSTPVEVSADIFDVTGRRLCRLRAAGILPAGTHALRWDGRDDLGQQAPTGVYLLAVRAGDRVLSMRLLHMK